MKKIKIGGIKDLPRFEGYVASSLVNIAYIQDIIEGTITLLLESDINLNNIKDEKWLMELLNDGLIECEETSAYIFTE